MQAAYLIALWQAYSLMDLCEEIFNVPILGGFLIETWLHFLLNFPKLICFNKQLWLDFMWYFKYFD